MEGRYDLVCRQIPDASCFASLQPSMTTAPRTKTDNCMRAIARAAAPFVEASVTGVGSTAAISPIGRITTAPIATRGHCFITIPRIWKPDPTACLYGRTTQKPRRKKKPAAASLRLLDRPGPESELECHGDRLS